MKDNDSSSLPANILDQLEVIWPRYDLHDHKIECFIAYMSSDISNER